MLLGVCERLGWFQLWIGCFVHFVYLVAQRMSCLFTVRVIALLCLNVVFGRNLKAFTMREICLLLDVCCLNVIEVSLVTPEILGVCMCGWGMLLIARWGMCLCSPVQLVNSVTVDFDGVSRSLFDVNQSYDLLRYGWSNWVNIKVLRCVHVSVMLSV